MEKSADLWWQLLGGLVAFLAAAAAYLRGAKATPDAASSAAEALVAQVAKLKEEAQLARERHIAEEIASVRNDLSDIVKSQGTSLNGRMSDYEDGCKEMAERMRRVEDAILRLDLRLEARRSTPKP